MEPASESPLRNRNYRRLFGAQVASLAGTGLTTVALALLAHDLVGGDAGLVLGTVLALKMGIYVLVAPLIGALASHVPRKPLLVGLDILRALIVVALPFVDSLWQIYVLVGLLNIGPPGSRRRSRPPSRTCSPTRAATPARSRWRGWLTTSRTC